MALPTLYLAAHGAAHSQRVVNCFEEQGHFRPWRPGIWQGNPGTLDAVLGGRVDWPPADTMVSAGSKNDIYMYVPDFQQKTHLGPVGLSANRAPSWWMSLELSTCLPVICCVPT